MQKACDDGSIEYKYKKVGNIGDDEESFQGQFDLDETDPESGVCDLKLYAHKE